MNGFEMTPMGMVAVASRPVPSGLLTGYGYVKDEVEVSISHHCRAFKKSDTESAESGRFRSIPQRVVKLVKSMRPGTSNVINWLHPAKRFPGNITTESHISGG